MHRKLAFLSGAAEAGSSRTLRVIVTLSVLLLVTGAAGTAIALALQPTSNDRVTMFTSEVVASNFDVRSYDAKVKGVAKIEVDVELKNLDAENPHRANVTVQILNAAGDVVAETTEDTGTVDGDSTWEKTFSFSRQKLAIDYARTVIIVDDSA